MRLLKIATIAGAAFLLFGQADTTLQKAIRKETVEGDLKGAIELYRKAMSQAAKDRATAAQALVHMGACYETLGDAEARKAYERVVREFSDQPEAVRQAQTHLAAARPMGAPGAGQPGRQTTTLVWSGPKVDNEGSLSPDGRYFSYPDWQTGNLALHDFVTGNDRAITTAGTWKQGDTAFAEESAISRDGKQIAYCWYEHKTNRFDLRVANLTGDSNARKLFESSEMRFVAPQDWSPDGKWIALTMEPENSDARTGQLARPGMKAAIAMVSVQDGSVRVLKTTDWSEPDTGYWKARFSPDGKYLAYDRNTGPNNSSGVFVMDLATGREFPVSARTGTDQLAAWSPDGKYILFTSKRTGTAGLWAMRFSGGALQGEAELVKANLGSTSVVGMTTAGALYYFLGRTIDPPRVQVAGFDIATGKLTSEPAGLVGDESGEGSSWPDWSPDGKSLAYLLKKPAGSGYEFSIKIRTMVTGESRELHPGLGNPTGLSWTPDGRSILISDAYGAPHRVDIQSGEASMVAKGAKGSPQTNPPLSPDLKALYYIRHDGAESAFVELDLASGKEREIIRRADLGWVNLSPDGRYIATPSIDPTDHARTFLIIPVNGGSPHDVIRLTGEPEAVAHNKFKDGWLSVFAWAPDSKSVLIRKRADDSTNTELWQAFVDGRESRRLTDKLDPRLARGAVRLHPDGRRIALTLPGGSSKTPRAPAQMMVLENFLPAPH